MGTAVGWEAAAAGADPARLAGCVFCTPEAQPPALLEGERLRVVPDLYPLAPGHTLIMTTAHHPCLGAADPASLAELEPLTARVRQFVSSAYGIEPVVWENGVAGQTVLHAHLHVIPLDQGDLIDRVGSEGVVEVEGWPDVVARYQAQGAYHYAQLGARRFLLESNGVANWEVRRLLAISAGLRFEDGRWVRPTSAADVEEVGRRWAVYHSTHN